MDNLEHPFHETVMQQHSVFSWRTIQLPVHSRQDLVGNFQHAKEFSS